MTRPKIWDYVKVVSGPAFVPDGAALVRVRSGGDWGFMHHDLAKSRRPKR